jgi:hypothetical protein
MTEARVPRLASSPWRPIDDRARIGQVFVAWRGDVYKAYYIGRSNSWYECGSGYRFDPPPEFYMPVPFVPESIGPREPDTCVVPREATPEMIRAAVPMYDAMLPGSEWPFTRNLYRAMLAARPQPKDPS